MKHKSNTQWGGRFKEEVNKLVARFTASIHFDQRLYVHDIAGSIAHTNMLCKVGVLCHAECNTIVSGLIELQQDIAQGRITWDVKLEDIHMHIESYLIAKIGPVGKKLHTGRSRNDQVATDLRMWLREEITNINQLILKLKEVLVQLAEKEAATIMPGLTHLQIAQPITFGHHLMAWYEMFDRDQSRLEDCYQRMNICPLGAAALAGTSYPIDRHYTASALAFTAPANNSLDAVSDRDFAIEFCADAALLMMHFSRCAEEIVLWTSPHCNFIELPDAFCTGSSIMPQKKNPDVPELIRGKTGRINGHLVALLTLMKSQPLAYNKDNQEDKEPLFDSVDTLKDCLEVFTAMIPLIKSCPDRMQQAANKGFSTATDLADYLVKKKIHFREAHHIVGQIVSYCIAQNKTLVTLTLTELMQFSPVIKDDIFAALTVTGSVNARNHWGGTAPCQVLSAITAAKKTIQKSKKKYNINYEI